MTEEEKKDHAERICLDLVRGVIFADIYEDDRLAESDATDDDLEAIHTLALDARVTVAW